MELHGRSSGKEFSLTGPHSRSYKSVPSFRVALPSSPLGRSPSHLPKLGSTGRETCATSHVSTHRKEAPMPTGSVKWFNPTKGYGFIQPQGGGKDVFVHISAVERAGLSTLNEGQIVQYEIVNNRGKESADNLKVGG